MAEGQLLADKGHFPESDFQLSIRFFQPCPEYQSRYFTCWFPDISKQFLKVFTGQVFFDSITIFWDNAYGPLSCISSILWFYPVVLLPKPSY
ncbi:MAG: hypothetical protein ACOYD6_02315 [Limnochordia bacterium]|jgi:hypothetical protein